MYKMHSIYCKNILSACLRVQSRTRFLSQAVHHDKKLPLQAEIVIAGGGVIGTSIAYHLTNLGWRNILLLEQGSSGCGTSWHAAGLCGSVRSTKADTDNCRYALDLYSKFEEETGVGFKRCGSLYLAQVNDRAVLLKKTAVKAKQFGVECELVTPEEAGRINPFIKTDDIKLGLHVPGDGVVNPTDLIQAYLKRATKEGATTYIEGIEVENIITDGHRVAAVDTNYGKVDCNVFINCAGLWARELGMKSNTPVDIPIHASEHFYIVTKPIENMHSMLPVTRDYDARTFAREWSGGLMCGGVERMGKPCFYDKVPGKFEFQLLPEDWEHFGNQLMGGLLNRYPCLQDAEIRSFLNGPESFTFDTKPHCCKSIELSNYYFAAGMSSYGIISSAGLGRAMSELVTHGETSNDASIFDVRRIPKGFNNKYLLHDSIIWSLRLFYELIYPKKNFDPNGCVMHSPLHELQNSYGVVWYKSGNWDVPMYFKSEHEVHSDTFGRPDWLSNIQSEMKTCEEDIGIIDFSSKSKFDIMCSDGSTLSTFLSSLCLYDVNKMDAGDFVDNILLNKTNGCQATFSLAKVNDNKYTMITSPDQHTYVFSRLHESIQENKHDIVIEDISGKYAALGLLGPHVEELLNELLAPPHSTDDVLVGTCRPVDIGYASKVQLVNHFMNGINGWQLFVPTEFSQGLYQLLMKYGEKYKIKNVGHFTLDSIRVGNMIPMFGTELDARTDAQFIKDIYTQEKKHSESSLQLIEISIPSCENWPSGEEPVLYGEHIIGNLSSVGYTKANDKLLGLFVTNTGNLELGKSLNVKCGDDVYYATVV